MHSSKTFVKDHLDGLALRSTRNIGHVQAMHHQRAAGRSGYNLRRLVGL
jgi:hypothetical protein